MAAAIEATKLRSRTTDVRDTGWTRFVMRTTKDQPMLRAIWLCGVRMRRTLRGLRIRTPSSSPPFTIIRANRAVSDAVENRPAWPETPPILRVVGSWTTPRRNDPSASLSVGAVRSSKDGSGRKVVSFMPRGSKMRSRANRSIG